ncbi:uncharacterized protein LOC124662563 [Lolium rigidum]|uniref:uncharacterized protein LOC124662563 n=1 Tax=Lolium rigidum TaxID=89674 RepID=UPI001F5D354B|nr:uncharacterized protein LOC124662563 [Lolium rigidum]
MTLWEQLSSTPDPAIRDILKIPHEADDGDRRPCTLMDAIVRESRGEGGDGRVNWKPLRDRLWLRRAANASSTTTRNRRGDEDGSEEGDEESEAPAVASMSLMALLEQSDSQWDDQDDEEDGASKSGAVHVDGDGDGDGREEEEQMVRACCVCMVRHKGAAFIPCGHTFCRPCSRDLWRTRADCPLCNAFIHDILHIF